MAAIEAVRHMEVAPDTERRHTHPDEAEASSTDKSIHIPGKRSTPSPSPHELKRLHIAGSAKRTRGAPAAGVPIDGDQGVMDSSDEQEGDSTRRHSKRGPGPPHAIIVPELEKEAADLALWRFHMPSAGSPCHFKVCGGPQSAPPQGGDYTGKHPPHGHQHPALSTRGRPYEPRIFLRIFDDKPRELSLSLACEVCEKKRTIFEAGTRGYWVTGMHASGPSVNRVRTQARSRAKGYCHCGCDEEAVLFEFAMWKRWQVFTGTSDDTKSQHESLRGQFMDPRMRLFVKAAYERDTGLSLDDWLAGASTQADAAWAHCQTVIDHYQRKLATLSGEPNTEFKDAVCTGVSHRHQTHAMGGIGCPMATCLTVARNMSKKLRRTYDRMDMGRQTAAIVPVSDCPKLLKRVKGLVRGSTNHCGKDLPEYPYGNPLACPVERPVSIAGASMSPPREPPWKNAGGRRRAVTPLVLHGDCREQRRRYEPEGSGIEWGLRVRGGELARNACDPGGIGTGGDTFLCVGNATLTDCHVRALAPNLPNREIIGIETSCVGVARVEAGERMPRPVYDVLCMDSDVPKGKRGTFNVGLKESGGVIGMCELSQAGLSLAVDPPSRVGLALGNRTTSMGWAYLQLE
ncbi:hypothetical protein JB92DRAFT_2839385 [Gautieria morchelliformis]|nr:hypothetical protein JB92DRAFT_2839385 [Gautieria morchelliformis]